MDAAYVNLDGDNIGLLHNADVRIKQKDGTYKKGGDEPIGKLLTPGEMIAVQAKSSYIPKAPDLPEGPSGDKNPRVSMNITLQGRYVIYGAMENGNRISRRIRDDKMRTQMMDMLDSVSQEKGCILRAAAANTQTDIIRREAKIHIEAWRQIQGFFEGDDPSLIMEGPDAVQRTLCDHAHQVIDKIELTTMDHFQLIEEWCEVYAPDLVTKIVPVELPDPNMELGLYTMHGVVEQVEAVLQPYTIMNKGATLIIQETAALIAIDINRGGDDRSHLNINLDAAKEIARQVRLRNLGGIIVIDFLKMKKAADKTKLKQALEEYFDDDPCTVQFHGFTKLGLGEVTRQRRTPPLLERFETLVE